MKRAKSIVAITVASSLTLSMVMPVFGSVFANRTPRVVPVEVVEVVVVPPTTQERLNTLWNYPNLSVGSRPFIDQNSNVRGRLPVLSPAPAGSAYETMNNRFFTNIFRHHWHAADRAFGQLDPVVGSAFVGGTPTAIANDFDGFNADFSVVNQGRYAVITQTGDFGNALDRITQKRPGGEFVTIVNKASRSQATQAQLNAYMAEVEALRAQVAAEAAAPVSEPDEFEMLELDEAEVVEGAEEDAEEGAEESETASENESDASDESEASEASEASDEVEQEFFVPLSSATEFGLEIVLNEEENLVELMFEGTLVAAFVLGSNAVVVYTGETEEIVILSAETLLYEDGEVYAPLDLFTVALGLVVADVTP
jgi:hypothetical protein